MNDPFTSLHAELADMPVFSDHEHHHPDEWFAAGMSLDRALASSYVSWTGFVPPPDQATEESRRTLLDHVRFNSYFTWFEKGVQHLHGLSQPITLETWDDISRHIREAYAGDPDFHWKALRRAGFERLVLDTYWDPGSDNGHPEIFSPTFRVDKFMYGFHADSVAPDEFCPWKRYGFEGKSLGDWVDLMRQTIRRRHEQGRVVALKCAEAYNRTIDFQPDDEAAAHAAFGVPPDRITAKQRLAFGNYIFNRCCELAAELDVPVQVHTGLGRLSCSRPMLLEPTILAHPRTRFVLFHAGYPWTHEVAGLAHNHANVLPSLTWTATISTSAAIAALHEFIDVSRSSRHITWGSDCWVAEESAGALLAWRFIVVKVLSERLADGRLTAAGAEALARRLLYENGRAIYLGQAAVR